MKSKKFVLAALVLLAITGLLALAGCKNDSVPETPAAKLVSISVTPPARTVYSVGEEVVHKKDGEIGVTATYDDRTTSTVTGTITTDTSTLTQSAGIGKTITVSYTEGDTTKEATFTVDVVNVEEPTKLTSYTSPNHTGSKWTYVAFGEWPQTIMKAGVTVDESEGKQMGMFTCYLGDDGNYYVKAAENAYGSGTAYLYTNGDQAGQGGTYTKWFKVEPIKWRVLTEDYKDPYGKSTGNALLLAESILTGGIPYYHFDRGEVGLGGMGWNGLRIIGGKEIYPYNYEHSQIRAWLNGLSYQSKESEGATQSPKDEYKNAGFLQTAFTESAQKLIELTSVDNSAASTNPASNPKQWKEGENLYASKTPTTDKVFLLSEQEATTLNSGFGAYSEKDSARIRVTTDYAKATGANQNSTEGAGGWWWLRSPYYSSVDCARDINYYGIAYNYFNVYHTYGGVVPALSISLGGN